MEGKLQVGESMRLLAIDNGSISINDDVLKYCFLREDVKDLPVCLISIIGKEGMGKSFLLNYLLWRLNNLESRDQEWMGGADEDLRGFEWKSGLNTTTKGVFIWSKPFLIDTEQGKVAVFLMDTEGCDGVDQDKGISVQLSTLSMLLSSYLIYNVSKKIQQTDLEFLELFLHVAQKVGEVSDLEPIQHLDILIRDWQASKNYGMQAGKQHLDETIQKVENGNTQYQPSIKMQLSRSQCFLMPYPGKKIAMGFTGHVKDLDEDFRDSLVDYFSSVLETLPTCARRDIRDSIISCSQLFDLMKAFVQTIKKYSVQIKTPLQNADVGRYVTTPGSMQACLLMKANELKEDCQRLLRGTAVEKRTEATELNHLLAQEIEISCNAYNVTFQGQMARRMDAILNGLLNCYSEEVPNIDAACKCVSTTPSVMRNLLGQKAMDLSVDFQICLLGSPAEIEIEVTNLNTQLLRKLQDLCAIYNKKYKQDLQCICAMLLAVVFGTIGMFLGALEAGPVLARCTLLIFLPQAATLCTALGCFLGLSLGLIFGVVVGIGLGTCVIRCMVASEPAEDAPHNGRTSNRIITERDPLLGTRGHSECPC
ncbi:uncharacterized protein LOC121274791 isoform X2 [Carcharodon carcharias]|uniref:uncharacterized protein LOC121274791 isoform X2 n=1 Tax=Carcharodon carcharias TaxID=13397 RepID=UPI001B7DE9FC|nr:uncharacterized protein LOC121274791 isoform X2 [Carcharodon carcharias]